MDISKLMSDENKEEEGVWITLSESVDEETGEVSTTEVKVARLNNPKYTANMEMLRKPHRNLLIAGQQIPAAKQMEITCQLFARTIVKDWKGFTDNGEPFPYSMPNCLRLLRESRDFRDLCAALAQEADLFRKEAEALAEGNSESSQDGGPTTVAGPAE